MTDPNKIDWPLYVWLDCFDEEYEARIYTCEGVDLKYPLVGEYRRKSSSPNEASIESWTIDGLRIYESKNPFDILPPKKEPDYPDEVYLAINEVGDRRLCYDIGRAREFGGENVQAYVPKGKPITRGQVIEIILQAINYGFDRGRNGGSGMFIVGKYVDEIMNLIEGRSDG